MRLIVGLGNPGIIYRNSRHNIGIRVVKSLAREHNIKLRQDKSTFSKQGRGKIKNTDFVLAHPLLFMNLSGGSISSLLKKYKLPGEDFLIVCDDLDLPIGEIRFRPRGSSGGHRGLRSIIEHIGTSNFARLRIGIGRPTTRDKDRIKDFVLSSFSKQDKVIINKTINKAVERCRAWLLEGMIQAMNRYN